MKLVSFVRNGGAEEVGILKDGGVLPVSSCGMNFSSMNDLIRDILPEQADALKNADGALVPANEVKFLAPIPVPTQDVICLGLNYRDHVAEASAFSKEDFSGNQAAVYFSKRVNRAPGDGGCVPAHENLTSQVDYEAELAVIIGRDAKDVAAADAAQYVFGYTVLNDMTARDTQTEHKQWYFGKSLDGFTPMGPCIVTADEIAFPPALRISSRVNGELRQDGNTGMMIHGVAEVISELSRGMTLKAGTIIATGTPKGVGMGMAKPSFLKKGDTVTCEIEGIGSLTVTIV